MHQALGRGPSYNCLRPLPYRSGHVSWGLVIWLDCIKEEKPNSDNHSEDKYGDYTCKQQDLSSDLINARPFGVITTKQI